MRRDPQSGPKGRPRPSTSLGIDFGGDPVTPDFQTHRALIRTPFRPFGRKRAERTRMRADTSITRRELRRANPGEPVPGRANEARRAQMNPTEISKRTLPWIAATVMAAAVSMPAHALDCAAPKGIGETRG